MSSIIDIGVNLTSSAFNQDCDAVIERAQQAGLSALNLISSNLSDSLAAIELTQRYSSCCCTVGVHPHHASEFNQHTLDSLRDLASHKSVRAIGETGLDFNRNYSPQKDQITAFEQQLELASETKLPVFLHQRDAHSTFYPILKNYRDVLIGGVVHCFTGNREELHAYLELDLHIGITGWVCDERRGYHLHDMLQDIPLNRLMLESDAPYLIPRDIRPKPKTRRNEPAFLTYVLARVAQSLEISENQVALATSATAHDFFKLEDL